MDLKSKQIAAAAHQHTGRGSRADGLRRMWQVQINDDRRPPDRAYPTRVNRSLDSRICSWAGCRRDVVVLVSAVEEFDLTRVQLDAQSGSLTTAAADGAASGDGDVKSSDNHSSLIALSPCGVVITPAPRPGSLAAPAHAHAA